MAVERHPINGVPALLRRFMTTRVPVVTKGDTIRDVIALLKKKSATYELIDYIYVVDKTDHLIGVFSVREMFTYSLDSAVERVMNKQIVSATPKTEIEVIADLALRHSIKSIPIVQKGVLLGVVPSKSILQILNRSLRKDIFHFAGIHKSHLEYENTLTVPLTKSVMHRAPWLLVGLMGIILTAAFISIFRGILEEYLILASFIPAITYMSGALGMQIETLFVRDLAVMGSTLNQRTYLFRQTIISFVIACIVATIIFSAVSLFWMEPYLGFVIGIATFCALMFSNVNAFAITVMVKRLGYDPALGGGPFATVISDATSIVMYFVVVSLLL